MTTTRNFNYRFLMGKGPRMLRPHCANGQGDDMGVISSDGEWQVGESLAFVAASDELVCICLYGRPVISRFDHLFG